MKGDREVLANVLEASDDEALPALEVAKQLGDALDLPMSIAQDRVEAALDTGVLVEEDVGAFGAVRLADDSTESGKSSDTGGQRGEQAGSGDANPGGKREKTPEAPPDEPAPPSINSWAAAGFAEPDAGTWPPAQIKRDAWMCRAESKAPYAPWADADAPVECNHPDHNKTLTCADCGNHAGYKWGSNGSREHVHADHATAREWADMDPSLPSDLVFIQRDDDPLAFVDGDDVRDPETEEVHPAFRAILEHLGVTYADISTSGSGVHAVYRGEIPLDGVPEATFDLDTEPFGANDEPPAIEIYDGKHVCIATGDHVGGTGTEATEWDDDALADILRANGYEEREQIGADSSVDFDDYEPKATGSDETTDDIRDVFRALDRLDPKRVGERTIVREWTRARRSFLPTWGSSDDSGTANYIDDRIWHDTGRVGGYGGPAVMAAIDANLISHRGAEPSDVSGKTFFKAIDHLRGLGFSIPRYEPGEGGDDGADGEDSAEYRTDPRRVEATVDPRRAWEAAGRVEPAELDQPLPLDHTDDREAWLVDGHRVDVVRAVAVAEGLAETASDPITDGYPEAYQLARDRYGAPLPAYYTTADAIAEFDAVLDVVGELTFWDLDTDALDSNVTKHGGEVGGNAVRALDPAWRQSDSGASVLVFESGKVWDADTDTTLSPLRFVALDAGVFCHPRESWDDGEFSAAYQLAREEYGAPLPRWEPAADGERGHTAQLPEPDDLADTRPFSGVNTDALNEARKDVEALLNDTMTGGDNPTVIRALPATGKTTGAVKNAAGAVDGTGIPSSYLSPRKELQKQALEKADRWGADARVLPVFSDDSVVDEILTAAVSHVRKAGKQRLRDRWAVLAAAADAGDEEDLDDLELFEDGDEEEDSVELDRPTCETADGLHGPAWALVVHVARRLGYTPREIHTQARGLFGAPLPCMCDENGTDVSNVEGEGCRYSLGWSDVADPDDPADLLVGSYVHAHVESVRTFYERDGDVRKRPRAVVVDEFPGEAFSTEYGEEALDFATWLTGCLQDDVDDRRDMYEADLGADGWVSAWLDGDGDDHDAVAPLADALSRCGDLLDAREGAADIRDSVGPSILDTFDLAAPLSGVSGGNPAGALEDLEEALDSIRSDQRGASLARMVDGEVAAPLRRATNGDGDPGAGADIDAAPIGGDLAQLVERGLGALDADTDSGREAVRAATTALRGGREGCRRLAAWADDGYAHPDAHHFLNAVVTPTDDDADDPGARRIDTDGWAFDPDATDGTVLDIVDTGERARVLLDRNDHGAVLHTPPGREAGNGELAPLVGLDATARRDLWATALLEDVVVEDIHDTDAERAAFLEEALDLRVLQAADRPRPYEGDPATKDTDGDVALLEALAGEYSGIAAPRGRDDDLTTIGKPAAVTTDCVRSLLESDDRLEDIVAAWENYGNLTGSNELGGHRLAAVLGCQHYGDDAVERFAALAGENVDTDRRDGRGAELAYGSGVADEYLAHMQEDQTMQAVLRFARGGSGATVVARTSALRDDLPVVGRAQVVETWSDTAASIAGAYRRLGDRFTAADVGDVVDVSTRHVRRVLAELVEAGYLRHVGGGDGTAKVYESAGAPGAGEVELPDRGDAVANGAAAGRGATKEYYTWNVRVERAGSYLHDAETGVRAAPRGAPPAPRGEAAGSPPG